MEQTYTIYAPGAWVDDIEPAMEDWHARTDLTPAQDEVVEQYWDNSRVVKKGKGYQQRFDLTSLDAVRFLREEAKYRAEFWSGSPSEYMDEKNYGARNAGRTLMERCDAVLKAAEIPA